MKDANEAQNLGEQLKVRREKLKILQDSGQDPFSITKFNVTSSSRDIIDNFEQNEGKNGKLYDEQHAVCLEAQNWPDSINHPAFPNIILRPGEQLDETTEYRFL